MYFRFLIEIEFNFMKKLLFTAFFITCFSFANAQAYTGKGDQKLNFGLNAWGYGTGLTGTYDYGINDLLSVGAGLNVFFANYKNDNKDNNLFAFARANFHLNKALDLPEKLDLYPGVDIGVVGKEFGFGAHLGARYFFTQKIGVFAELGNNGSLGVSINL
jgi:hypothetical protein